MQDLWCCWAVLYHTQSCHGHGGTHTSICATEHSSPEVLWLQEQRLVVSKPCLIRYAERLASWRNTQRIVTDRQTVFSSPVNVQVIITVVLLELGLCLLQILSALELVCNHLIRLNLASTPAAAAKKGLWAGLESSGLLFWPLAARLPSLEGTDHSELLCHSCAR